ncbi:MAG: hypothetical protein M3373_14745, partial [Gemmatimonadota bacterium]|nr:hypothetical protein [Gemmatimonadota bacterium]
SEDVRAWMADPAVAAALGRLEVPGSAEERARGAAGAPGSLLRGGHAKALAVARELVSATTKGDAEWARALLKFGGSGARGLFSEVLDALTLLLHERLRSAAGSADERQAASISHAIEAIEQAKGRAAGNVNPQLLAASLGRNLREAML